MRKIILQFMLVAILLSLVSCGGQSETVHINDVENEPSIIEIEAFEDSTNEAEAQTYETGSTEPNIVTKPEIATESEVSYRHPFAVALADFFAEPVSVIDFATYYFWLPMPYANHAIFVDMDGIGTVGVLASRWRYETRALRSNTHRFEQNIFWLCDGDVREEVVWDLSTTLSGQLVQISVDGACNNTVTRYTLFGFVDGELVRTTTLGIWEFWVHTGHIYENGNIFEDPNSPIVVLEVNYGLATHWRVPYRYDDITSEEAYEFMTQHDLHGATHHVWEWADQTHEILAMTIDCTLSLASNDYTP